MSLLRSVNVARRDDVRRSRWIRMAWLPSGGTRRASARRAPRDTVRSASVTRERSALRASSRDLTVGVRERSGTDSLCADSATTMRGSNATMRAHPRMDAAMLGRLRRSEAVRSWGLFPQ